jgi:predicted ester cyclase
MTPKIVLLERRTALAAFGGLLASACATGAIGANNKLGNAAAMRNKTNYLAAKAAYNARDLDRCLAYYAPDHQIMSKPTPPGREHIRAFFEGTFATWPDVQIVVVNAVAEGDWVMGRSISTATHSAPVLGVAPTGKKIESAFWDLHRFNEQGLIVQTWNLTDNLSITQQLGVVS